MANNPLYPGYKPKKEGQESVNPTYPGYYVGGPVSKKKPTKDYLKPMEYNFDDLVDGIDEIGKEVASTPILSPKWYVDRVVDDWKGQLKVSVSPSGIKIDPTELDDYATDDLAGATTSLSLNSKDWGIGHEKGIEQTKAQIKKTLNAWVKEATGINRDNILESDFSDIQNKTNEELWNVALGYKEGGVSKLQKRAADEIAQRTALPFEDVAKSAYTYPSGEKLSPLDLKHRQFKDENGNIQVEEDTTYRELASKVSSFQRGRDNPRNRDKLHTAFLTNTFDSIRGELEEELGKGGLKIETPKQEATINLFNAKVDTLKEVEKFQKSIGDIADNLEKQAIIIKGSWRTQSDKKTEVSKLLSGATQQDGLFDSTFNRLSEISEKTKGLVKSGVPQQEVDFLLNEISKYEERIKSVRKSVVDATHNDRKNIRNLAKELRGSTPDKNFTSRTTFQDSLAGNLRKDLEKSILSKDEYSIGSVINDPNSNLRAKKIAPLVYRMRQDRVKFAAREVLNSFEKGGLSQVAETYVWNEIKKRMPATLERISSGGIVGDRLKRSNYYGLKMDDMGTPSDEFFEKNPKKLARFEKKFGNRATVQLDDRLKGLVGDGGKGKIVLSGSEVQEHLNIIGNPVLKSFKFDKSVEDQVLFARLINNDRSEEALDKLALKIWGVGHNELKDDQLNELNEFFKGIEKANKWTYQKSGGKIKALNLQNADHFKIFKNSQIGILTQTAVNQKDADNLILKMFKLDGEYGPKERKDVSINKLYKAITGKDWNALSDKERSEWLLMGSDIKKFSEWMRTQKTLFGDKVSDPAFRLKKFLEFKEKGIPVNVDQNNEAFLLIKNIFDKNNKLNDGYKLTQKKYLGRLEKINNKMQSLQKKFAKSKLGKLVKFVSTWQKLLAEKIVKLISKLIAKLTGVTIAALTGPLAALAPIIQAILEKVIERGIKYAQAFIKGVFKMDFKDLDKMLREDFKKLVQLVGVGCGCLLIASIPFLLLFFLLGTAINPIDVTRDNYDGYTVGILPTSGQPDPRMFSCSTGRGSCNIGNCEKNYGYCSTPTDFSEGNAGFYYSQCDPRWKDVPLGIGASEPGDQRTICQWGCAMTSIAMVSKYFGNTKADPPYINNMGDGVTDRFSYESIQNWDIPEVNREYLAQASPGALVNFFRQHPNGEGVVILELNGNCHPQHWVVITGMCEGDFIMYDPYSGPDVALSNVYSGEAYGRAHTYYVDGYCVSNDNVQTSCANGNDPAPDCVRRPAPTGNTLADTALDIACDLRKGFGCLYNRPAFSIMDPKYSHTGNVISNPGGGAELFDFDLWAQHGNSNWWDSSLHNCGHCLFWCTWLPVKVYNTVYHDSRLGAWGYGDGGYFSLSADSMCDPNTSENQMLNIKKVSGGPQSGDIPCYQWDEDGLFDHVGIVYEKVYFDAMEVGINVVESNSYPFLFYDKDPSGGTYSGHGATIMHFMRKGGHF